MKNRTCLLAWTLFVQALTASQSLAQSIYEPYTFTTLAGNADAGSGTVDGTGSDARFNYPSGVAVDSAGNVYVADFNNSTIRKIAPTGVVTTLAGSAGSSGSADGTGNEARFGSLEGVAVDSAGNVYVADEGNGTIRKVTPAGVVTTLAGLAGSFGSADGIGNVARFSVVFGVAVDRAGNLYVTDSGNGTIRKVTVAGVVTTLAGRAGEFGSTDGTGPEARFGGPPATGVGITGVAVDTTGNVYVADTGNKTIRKITSAGVVTTLAGLAGTPGGITDGTGNAARFEYPYGMAVDSACNVYVADYGNSTIRKITPAGVVTTLAGLAGGGANVDGTGSDARFSSPSGVAVDNAGTLYVADYENHAIRKGLPAVGPPVVLIEPLGQKSVTATYDVTMSVLVNGAAPLAYQWLKDGANLAGATNASYTIFKVQPVDAGVYSVTASNILGSASSSNGVLTVTPSYTFSNLAGLAQCCDPGGHTLAGSADGTGSAARFSNPYGVAVDNAGNAYVADSGNNTIRKVTPAGVVTTLAGLSQDTNSNGFPDGGHADGMGIEARFWNPTGVAVDNAGNLYVADSANNTIRKVTPTGVVTTLAGLAQRDANGNPIGGSADGTGSAAWFYFPQGVALDGAGNVYVADSANNTIRKVTPAGVVTTLAGMAGRDGSADGTGSAARFNYPSGVAVDSLVNVYVADSGNRTIRKVTPAGVVTTLAGLAGTWGSADGTASAARFGLGPLRGPGPSGVAVDSAGNVYVTDTSNSTIRKVTPGGVVTTLAGLAEAPGSADGIGSAARFYWPFGVAVDSAGNVYVADSNNNTIRKGYLAPRILNSGTGFGFNGGQFGFSLTGPAGRLVVVEASTDLVSWLSIWTNTYAAALHFSDPATTNYPARFYRSISH